MSQERIDRAFLNAFWNSNAREISQTAITCSAESESDDSWDQLSVVERYKASKEVDAKRKLHQAEIKAGKKTMKAGRLRENIVLSQQRLYDEMEAATKKAAIVGNWTDISIGLSSGADVLAFTEVWAKTWEIPGYELVIKHSTNDRGIKYYRPGKAPRKEHPKGYSSDAITYRQLSWFRRVFK